MRAHMIVKRASAREGTSTETAFERPVVSMRDHMSGEFRRLNESTRTVSALVRLLWWFAKLGIFVLTRADFTAWTYMTPTWAYVILAWTYLTLAWTYVVLPWASTFLAGNGNGRS